MSAAGRLIPDLLSEIMFRLPWDIEEKFAFAQVSRLWRDLALNSPLFWSSFAGRDDYRGVSEADCYRLPLLLERCGSSTMLHIRFLLTQTTDLLKVLVPYAARIETLDVEFREGGDVEPLLGSNLEFPALKILRLEGPEWGRAALLSLTAPQLRTLDIQHLDPINWGSLLSPTLENIRLYQAGDANVETLSDIFKQCPRAWRVVLHANGSWDSDRTDHDFDVFARRPLAPALRELDLRLADSDLGPVLKAGFSDVVLHTLTGCIDNGNSDEDLELLTGALLPGLGTLVGFQLLEWNQIELRDQNGHIRRLQCWNNDASFEVRNVWGYLSTHYDLCRTIREIRMRLADLYEYVKIFQLYPPQLQDGITLAIETDWDTSFSRYTHDEGDSEKAARKLPIPGLARVGFFTSRDRYSSADSIFEALANIEPTTARKVEVCIGNNKLRKKDQDAFAAFRTGVQGDHWVICSHCFIG
ncbi:hypothetical protein B0H19DRAFT_1265789 [Mycena capillaripes]|nr:hypothetical protein B0H19DRAFT_1265789 [Mycena capillaripes]